MIIASGTAVLTTIVAGSFQMVSMRAGNNASAIDSPDERIAYEEYAAQTRSSQNAAYVGYGGMSVLSAIVFWRWNINSKQKAKEQADLTLYQTSLKQPISLNPERGTPQ